jgi:hypothetical protein
MKQPGNIKKPGSYSILMRKVAAAVETVFLAFSADDRINGEAIRRTTQTANKISEPLGFIEF